MSQTQKHLGQGKTAPVQSVKAMSQMSQDLGKVAYEFASRRQLQLRVIFIWDKWDKWDKGRRSADFSVSDCPSMGVFVPEGRDRGSAPPAPWLWSRSPRNAQSRTEPPEPSHVRHRREHSETSPPRLTLRGRLESAVTWAGGDLAPSPLAPKKLGLLMLRQGVLLRSGAGLLDIGSGRPRAGVTVGTRNVHFRGLPRRGHGAPVAGAWQSIACGV